MQEVRLIDANALHAKILEENRGNFSATENVAQILLRIETAPTIETELVRHGRWKGWTTSKFTGKYEDYDEPVFKDYIYYTCSECYRKSAIKELYCPHCGAKMDGGADNG